MTCLKTYNYFGAMVVAQLVQQSHPIPEIRGLNPDIGKILSTYCTIEKTKIKKKEAGNGPSFYKKNLTYVAHWRQHSTKLVFTLLNQ